MKRYLVICAAAAALAVPAAAAAADQPSPNSLASQSCKTQLSQMGTATFKLTYGGAANAFGKCVSKATTKANSNVQNAAQQCKAEQAMSDADFTAAHSGKTFNQLYGSNTQSKGKNAGANAYGKCVSTKAQAATQQATTKTVAAAKACRTELAASKSTFATTYGSARNAFGVCVSRKSNSKSSS